MFSNKTSYIMCMILHLKCLTVYKIWFIVCTQFHLLTGSDIVPDETCYLKGMTASEETYCLQIVIQGLYTTVNYLLCMLWCLEWLATQCVQFCFWGAYCFQNVIQCLNIYVTFLLSVILCPHNDCYFASEETYCLQNMIQYLYTTASHLLSVIHCLITLAP